MRPVVYAGTMKFFNHSLIISLALVVQLARAETDCGQKAGLYIRAMANQKFAQNTKEQTPPFRVGKVKQVDQDLYYKEQKLRPEQIIKLKAEETVYSVSVISADGYDCLFYAMSDLSLLKSKNECSLKKHLFDHCAK
jgi:hypothetical protein